MQYLALIHSDEEAWAALSEHELKDVMEGYYAFSREGAEATTERGADADIGNALAPGAIYQRRCGVYAIFRDDTVVRFQIGGRESDRMASAVAPYDDTLDTVWPPEHSAGDVYTALR